MGKQINIITLKNNVARFSKRAEEAASALRLLSHCFDELTDSLGCYSQEEAEKMKRDVGELYNGVRKIADSVADMKSELARI